jgi:hypothetical protein
VIYITAHDDLLTHAGAEGMGCVAYFSKAASGADVLAAIRRTTA